MRQLNVSISQSIGVYVTRLRKVSGTQAGFEQVQKRARELAGPTQLNELDRLAAQAPEQTLQRMIEALLPQTRKLAAQHWRWVQHFLRLHPPAAAGSPAENASLDHLLPWPLLGIGASGKTIAPLTPASLTSSGQEEWVRVGCLGALMASFLCLCLFVAIPLSRPAGAVQATGTALAQATGVAIAQATELSHSTDNALASETATQQPSSTASLTQTSPPVVSIVLPLTIASTKWKYIVEQAAAFDALGDGSERITPSLGRYLVLVGQLRNDGSRSECLTDREWELTDATSGEAFHYDFYAETRVRSLYRADPPGTFFGTCLGSGEAKAVFVVFNVKTDAQLAIVFHRNDGGQLVRLGTALTIAAAPTATAIPSPTQTSTPTSTDTPAPTDTPSPTPTVAPETQTAQAVLSATARMAATRTERARPTATRTARPSPTPSPEPNYLPIAARIARGEKVYYGLSLPKAYGFQILGGSEQCPSLPSGRGLLVLYPNGSIEWKDRGYIITSGLFFVRDDDPAIKAMDWMEYHCP